MRGKSRSLSLLVIMMAIVGQLPAVSHSFAADLSITAANVALGSATTKVTPVQFGETVTAGMPVYLKASDKQYYKADNDDTDSTVKVVGITVTAGTDNSYGLICTGGTMNIGATTVAGQTYVVSSTAGGIAPPTDLGSADRISLLMTAVNTTGSVIVDLNNTGYTVP